MTFQTVGNPTVTEEAGQSGESTLFLSSACSWGWPAEKGETVTFIDWVFAWLEEWESKHG